MTHTLRVNVWVCHNNDLYVQFKDVSLRFEDNEEHSNKNLNHHFEVQHPELYAQLPHWTDNRGFHFVAGIECEILY